MQCILVLRSGKAKVHMYSEPANAHTVT